MKNILIKRVPDDLYYKVKALKANLNCDTWIDFLKKVEESLRPAGL